MSWLLSVNLPPTLLLSSPALSDLCLLALCFQLLLARPITEQPLIKTEEAQWNGLLKKEEKDQHFNTTVSYELYSSPFPHLLSLTTWSDFCKTFLTTVLNHFVFQSLFSFFPWISLQTSLLVFSCLSLPLYNLTLPPSFLKSGGKTTCSLLLDLVKYISWHMCFLGLTRAGFEGDRTKLNQI